MSVRCPMLLFLLVALSFGASSGTRAKDGVRTVGATDSSVTGAQGDLRGAIKSEKDPAVLLQAQRTLSRWNWPWAAQNGPEVAKKSNRTDLAATLAMAASEKNLDQGEESANAASFSVPLDSQLIQQLHKSFPKPMPVPDSDKENKKPEKPAALASQTSGFSATGKSFSVRLDSQLVQLNNRTKVDIPSVSAAQTVKGGSNTRSSKSFSVKLDSQLLQQSNDTWALKKKLSAAIESQNSNAASKKQKGASFSVKLDSQLLQMRNGSDSNILAAALAAQGSREGKQTKTGATFSVKLDSQL